MKKLFYLSMAGAVVVFLNATSAQLQFKPLDQCWIKAGAESLATRAFSLPLANRLR